MGRSMPVLGWIFRIIIKLLEEIFQYDTLLFALYHRYEEEDKRGKDGVNTRGVENGSGRKGGELR